MLAQRLGEALRLRRDSFLWMVTQPRASGDAVLVVAGVFVVWYLLLRTSNLGVLSELNSLFGGVVSFLMAWVIATAAYWAVGRYLLHGSGQFWSALPVVGFAHAPLVLVPIGAKLLGLALVSWAAAAGWAMLMLAAGSRVALDLDQERPAIAAAAGVLGWFVGFFRF